MKTLLVTGGTGFIGSNFIPYILDKYSKYKIINLDILSYASDIKNLSQYEKSPRYQFIQGDICNRKLIESIFHDYNIEGVIHFAAESHVDNSIKNPDIFIQTNIQGTFILLDVAYKTWMDKPFKYKDGYKKHRFHHISTDEVYGSLGKEGLFNEETPYAPSSPYAASKASADIIVKSYHLTYGLNIVITNCSNNYGPKQHDEKLIPTIIRKALANAPIPIYGDGENIRDWLYVLDHCKAIDMVYHNAPNGEVYNIGSKNEKTNLEVVDKICSILDATVPSHQSYKNLIQFTQDRAGHDKRYAIDASKLENELGWKANETFDNAILKTTQWYIKKYKGQNNA